jgi:hypothetical protein
MVLTASGLKDPDVTAQAQPGPIAVPADLDAAVEKLQSEGLFPR